MWKLSAIVLGAAALATTSAAAEPAGSFDRPSVYRPGSEMQAVPLRVEVLDGTRFRDIETGAVYRLYGIATCAPGQVAHLGRQPWPCGTAATAWLVTATLGKWLSCATVREEDGEHLVRCASAEHADVAADLVHDGIAVSLPPTMQDPGVRAYAAAERDARKAYRGLWASTFEMPWAFAARFAGHTSETRLESDR